MHAARVQDDVCSRGDPVAVDDVIRQRAAHGEVDHRVEAQTLVDEVLQHQQPVKVAVLDRPVACGAQRSKVTVVRRRRCYLCASIL